MVVPQEPQSLGGSEPNSLKGSEPNSLGKSEPNSLRRAEPNSLRRAQPRLFGGHDPQLLPEQNQDSFNWGEPPVVNGAEPNVLAAEPRQGRRAETSGSGDAEPHQLKGTELSASRGTESRPGKLALPARSKRVRPYALTGGRTRSRYHLLVETLVSVPRYDPSLSDALMPESKALYERARGQLSIAELSALLSIPLGVVRVLISDLATQGAVFIHPTAHAFRDDRNVLERILRGLRELPV